MKVSEKLKIRLEKEFGITATEFKRTYAGPYQKDKGAWVWSAWATSHYVGSSYTMGYLVKCKKLEIYSSFGDDEIIPVDD